MFEAGVTAWLVLILMARKSFPPIPPALCLPVCIAHYSAMYLAPPGSLFTCTLILISSQDGKDKGGKKYSRVIISSKVWCNWSSPPHVLTMSPCPCPCHPQCLHATLSLTRVQSPTFCGLIYFPHVSHGRLPPADILALLCHSSCLTTVLWSHGFYLVSPHHHHLKSRIYTITC